MIVFLAGCITFVVLSVQVANEKNVLQLKLKQDLVEKEVSLGSTTAISIGHITPLNKIQQDSSEISGSKRVIP